MHSQLQCCPSLEYQSHSFFKERLVLRGHGHILSATHQRHVAQHHPLRRHLGLCINGNGTQYACMMIFLFSFKPAVARWWAHIPNFSSISARYPVFYSLCISYTPNEQRDKKVTAMSGLFWYQASWSSLCSHNQRFLSIFLSTGIEIGIGAFISHPYIHHHVPPPRHLPIHHLVIISKGAPPATPSQRRWSSQSPLEHGKPPNNNKINSKITRSTYENKAPCRCTKMTCTGGSSCNNKEEKKNNKTTPRNRVFRTIHAAPETTLHHTSLFLRV